MVESGIFLRSLSVKHFRISISRLVAVKIEKSESLVGGNPSKTFVQVRK